MAEYGNFDIFGDDWGFLFEEEFAPSEAIASTSSSEAKREISEVFDRCHQEFSSIQDQPANARFKKLSAIDLQKLEECRQSESTKKNTRWGVKLFQEWSKESEGEETDLGNITPEELNVKLRKFYAEAQPKFPEKRSEMMCQEQAKEYHKNTLKNVRSALNRYIKEIKGDIDIVRDKSFRSANQILDGKLKFNLKEGLSRPTKHKDIISSEDLEKITTYLHLSSSPVILRYRVWWDVAFHFVCRGLEFHTQLSPKYFEFHLDENNREYVVLTHETKEKKRQGGLDGREAPGVDKRMYGTKTDKCPVQSLRMLLLKTDPSATSLFNHISKDALNSNEAIWYTTKPVKKYQFTRFCGDISRNAKCSRQYTAHSIRATGIQAMNDAGFEIRHIMYMSGHRNEASVRSYNRECSTGQKKQISDVLSTVAQSQNPNVGQIDSSIQQQVPFFPQRLEQSAMYNPTLLNPVAGTHQLNSSNFNSSGFISNSSFSNCVFNFSNN